MKLYLMTYDLHRHRDYTKLYKLMTTWRAQRLMESVWLAELRGPAEVVLGHLQRAIDGDDSIAVIELKRVAEWNSVRAQSGGVRFLNHHIPTRD